MDSEEKKTNKCSLCGDTFGQGGVSISGEMICGDCIESMDLPDLLELIGCESVAELVGMLEGI